VSARLMAMVTKVGVATVGVALASAAFGLQAPELEQANQADHAAHAKQAPAVPADKTSPPTKAAAAAAAPAGGAADAGRVTKGREIFTNFACGTCHVLKDADGEGHVGPALDGNPNLTEALVVDRVTNGQGPMPSFGGQLTEQEIADVSYYVVQVAKK
jgi:mono/diheme cytochrome c family protein